MKLSQVYTYFGGNWATTMKELGLSPITYLAWRRKGYVPYRSQILIEKHTGGELVADTKDDIRVTSKSNALSYKQDRAMKESEYHD